MSNHSLQESWAEFREQIDIECGEYFFNEHGRLPTEDEQNLFFEDYLEGDVRVGDD